MPRRYFTSCIALLTIAVAYAACDAPPKAIPGNTVQMDFRRSNSFYSAPFPSEDLRDDNGRPDVSAFPNPKRVSFMKKLLALAKRDVKGFARTGAIYFQLSEELSPPDSTPNLPSMAQSTQPNATVFLIGVTQNNPDYGKRIPISIKFQSDAGPHGDKRLLSLLPLQGRPLRAATTYAAVIMRQLNDAKGNPLGVSLPMAQLAAGIQPTHLKETPWKAYNTTIQTLKEIGIDVKEIAGLSVFTTEDSTETMRQMVEYQRKQPLPTMQNPWKRTELFDDFCVFENKLSFPVYQKGTPPFFSAGGDWAFNADGTPQKQADEPSRIVVTIPRQIQPQDGWPTVLFVRTGGGGDRPLVDRGVREKPGGPAKIPGRGPGWIFAKAGWAGVSIDGPHGGLRNVSKGDEQFLIFNILNPAAMRDNIRQSALELTIVARLLKTLTFTVKTDQTGGKDALSCPGIRKDETKATIAFHPTHLALMGHSMGATIGPLAAALEPRFKALLLSGAGGSWIENIVHKQSPIKVRPVAEEVLRYAELKRKLHNHDPALTMLQWIGDPADPVAYAHLLQREPLPQHPRRHILMMQGIVDTYIMPPIANALSLSLGLDLAGPALDADHKELRELTPLAPLLQYTERQKIKLPASGNLSATTGVVTQHLQGPIEDGHEVVFQTTPPKHQYLCFLRSLTKGTPTVPTGAKNLGAACP